MASIGSASQLKFNCPICLDELKDPVSIPCGHSFCMVCINSCWDQEDPSGIYRCPQCRHSFSTRPVLHKNVIIAEMMENLKVKGPVAAPPSNCSSRPEGVDCDVCTEKAVKSCLVCLASYCEGHLQPHYESPAFKKHKLVKASKRLREQICSQHEKLLEVYCRTDQQCICMLCTLDEHKGHDTVSAAAERAEKQKFLEGTKRRSQFRIMEKQTQIDRVLSAMGSHRCSAQPALKVNQHIFTELIHFMERKCAEVAELITAQETSQVGSAEDLVERLERETDELRRRDAELEELLHTEDHVLFLQSLPSLSTPPKSTGHTSITFSPHYSYKEVTKLFPLLTQRVKDICEEEVKKISKGVMKIQIILPSTPKSREDFLKYSCELTLDPNTANTHLCLSEGKTTVSSSNNIQSYPDHPDRFDYWPQLLSKEHFFGSCYWEFEWSGNDGVFVAVSYAGISRKGRAPESVFGCNNQSWRLSCSPTRYSFWHNSKETALHSWSISSRIGVYVDYSAGTLSFYSVSDKMTLIYRAHATFTQPLYVGFLIHTGSMINLSS